jgi:hypothetical protein
MVLRRARGSRRWRALARRQSRMRSARFLLDVWQGPPPRAKAAAGELVERYWPGEPRLVAVPALKQMQARAEPRAADPA